MGEVVGRCPVCEAAIMASGRGLRWRICACRIPRQLTFVLTWNEERGTLTASCGSYAAHGRTLTEVRDLCRQWLDYVESLTGTTG